MTDTISVPFSSRAYVSLATARGIAAGRGHGDLTETHVALGVLRDADTLTITGHQPGQVSGRQLRRELEAVLPPLGHPRFGEIVLPSTPGEQQIIARAVDEAAKRRDPYLGDKHLLLAVLEDAQTPAARVLGRHGITYDVAVAQLDGLAPGKA